MTLKMGAIERALRTDVTARTPVLETPSSALSRHITLYVLLGGVLGGLLLVLLVLCCCKICCRPSKQLTRQPVLFTKYPSDRQSNSSRDSRKYKSLDPTIAIDLETSCGYSENSTSPRDHDDKSGDVQTSASATCSSPRLFADPITGMPEAYKVIDKIPPLPVTTITQRSPDELSFMMSPHSPRSPPFLRQSSICLDSDERLERLDSLREQAPADDAPTSPIAGPSRSPDSIFIIEVPTDDDEEDENEMEVIPEGNNMTVVGQQDLSSESPSPDTRPTCTRVAAEVHDAPVRFHKSMTNDDDEYDIVMTRVVRPTGTCSPPRPTSPLGEVPDSDEEVERRVGESDSGMVVEEEEEEMKRALGVGARMGAESVLQRTASTESGALVVMMEERRRLLIRQDGTQQESDEEDEEPRAKVRYNDTGSLEEVDARADALLGLFVDDSDSPPGLDDDDDDDDDDGAVAAAITTVAGYEPLQEDGEIKEDDSKEDEASREEEEARQRALLREQYRELWQLRTTLEIESGEDVEASGGTSSETSPEQEQPPTAVANGETKTPDEESRSPEDEPRSRPPPLIDPSRIPTVPDDDDTPDSPAEPPTPEQQARLQERRESYKSILTRRLQQRRASAGAGGGGGTPTSSADNSLEESASPSASAETGDSMEGGSSTDASRLTAGTTTSFESSTDTGESAGAVGGVDGMAGSRLQQMKADSGYKSLEADGKHPRLSHRQIPVTDATDSKDEGVSVDFEASVDSERAPSVTCSARSDEAPATQDDDEDKTDTQPPPAITTTSTVISSSITTYTTVIPSSMSMTEVRAISPSSSSVLDDEPAKSSVFARFFRSGRGDRPHHHHHHHPSRLFSRDYSIDEKSDALFREFSRLDPAFETETGLRCRSPRSHARHRSLHHQRSADPDHTGSPRHRRKLSQQDNIEEEIRLEVLSSPAPSGDSQTSPGSAIPVIKVALEEEASV